MTDEYNYDSKSILNGIGVYNNEDDHRVDANVAHDDDEDLLEVEEKHRSDADNVEVVNLEK